jgi:hypothetical protein
MDGCQFSSITTNMKKINSWQAERQLLPNRITADKREREREREERIIMDIETISKMHFADSFGLQNLHDLIW